MRREPPRDPGRQSPSGERVGSGLGGGLRRGAGRPHRDAGHLHRQFRPAPDPGRDRRQRHRRHLDLHRLSGERGGDDPPGRLADACAGPAQSASDVRGHVHSDFHPMRFQPQPHRHDHRPGRSGLLWGGSDPHGPDPRAHPPAAPPASAGHDHVRPDRSSGPPGRPCDRRMADRKCELAVVLLPERACRGRPCHPVASGASQGKGEHRQFCERRLAGDRGHDHGPELPDRGA